MSDLLNWWKSPPQSLQEKIIILKSRARYLKSKSIEGNHLRALLKSVEGDWEQLNLRARQRNPLAFFKPSYEQALVLNAWMWGITFVLIFTANRIGKTTVNIVNKLLWIFPNDPTWEMFDPKWLPDGTRNPEEDRKQGFYKDHLNRKVKVFTRPNISFLRELAIFYDSQSPSLQKPPDPRSSTFDDVNAPALQSLQKHFPTELLGEYPDQPWPRGGTIWFGAQDHDSHKRVIMPLWKQYLPESSIERYSEDDREITIQIKARIPTTWEIVGKSYETKDTKWASGAVDMIGLTEGIPQRSFNEVKLRFKDPGIGCWDYTPYEATNVGSASALASRIAKGKEKIPLRHFVFTRFKLTDAPDYIVPQAKKDDLVRSFRNLPEGAARLDGEFFASSALVLANLDRELHTLPWSAIQLFQKFPEARIYRGVDPGLDHPTAVAWAALLPNNIWVVYRFMSQRGLSISQRCDRIITLSNNLRIKRRFGPGPTDFYFMETHPFPNSEVPVLTVCDYKTFKQDETTKIPYSQHYTVNGLVIVESVHIGPEERAQLVDNLLLPSPFTSHPLTHTPPSPRIFFLTSEPGVNDALEIFLDFYWDRKKGGDQKGQPNDKVPDHGDDELDALSNIVCGPFRWTKTRPRARIMEDSEPDSDILQVASQINERNTLHHTHHFATIANHKLSSHPVEVVYFGESETESENEN